MNFGVNLKTFRKNNKLSQEELAFKLGVTRQSVSKWEVGTAYPEMSNIVALCSVFHCTINDLINDNIVDIDLFDEKTQEGIVKFKKEQQKKMKKISKTIYIVANVVKYLIIVPTILLFIATIMFPILSNSFSITDNKIKFLNIEKEYTISDNIVEIDGNKHYIESSTNIEDFMKNHNNKFFIFSIEYILICITILSILAVLSLHYLYKLYKNIYHGNTPFTLENEKLVRLAVYFILIELVLQKITAYIYSFIVGLDLAIDLNIKDIIYILIGVSIIYIFKYGRMIQVDSKAKIYD